MVSSVFTHEKHFRKKKKKKGGGGKRDRERVNWCFMPSQPVWLYQGNRERDR